MRRLLLLLSVLFLIQPVMATDKNPALWQLFDAEWQRGLSD